MCLSGGRRAVATRNRGCVRWASAVGWRREKGAEHAGGRTRGKGSGLTRKAAAKTGWRERQWGEGVGVGEETAAAPGKRWCCGAWLAQRCARPRSPQSRCWLAVKGCVAGVRGRREAEPPPAPIDERDPGGGQPSAAAAGAAVRAAEERSTQEQGRGEREVHTRHGEPAYPSRITRSYLFAVWVTAAAGGRGRAGGRAGSAPPLSASSGAESETCGRPRRWEHHRQQAAAASSSEQERHPEIALTRQHASGGAPACGPRRAPAVGHATQGLAQQQRGGAQAHAHRPLLRVERMRVEPLAAKLRGAGGGEQQG